MPRELLPSDRTVQPADDAPDPVQAERSGLAELPFDQQVAALQPAGTPVVQAQQVVQRQTISESDLVEVKRDCVSRLAAGDSYYALQAKKGIQKIVATVLRLKKVAHDEDDVAMLEEYLSSYQKTYPKTDFDGVVDSLGEQGGRSDYVDFLKEIEWPQGRKPGIAFGPAVTLAFYDPPKHTIVLDPDKMESATEMLDSLTFECQNGLQRKELRQAQRAKNRGEAVAKVEYLSDKNYIAAIIAINKATDIEDLVTKLEIPKKFLVEVPYKAGMTKVDRPSPSELPRQDRRQALWWWKTRSWTEKQQMQVWIAENHGVGVGSSKDIYD